MRIYAPFRKVEAQDDGTIVVAGIASTEAVDADGEIIKATAIAAALPDFMRHGTGALREMHQLSAAGTVISAVVDGAETMIEAHVVDPVAVRKVQAGVYKGFSIGGRVTGRDTANAAVITAVRLIEISLVDRPNNPDAVLTCWKVEDADQDVSLTKVEDMIVKALAPIADENRRLKAQIARLEAEPAPPKAVLRMIGKAEDGGHIADDDGFVPVLNPDGSVNEPATEMKKVHAAGPMRG